MSVRSISILLVCVSAVLIAFLIPATSENETVQAAPLPVPVEEPPESSEFVSFGAGCFWCVEEVFHQTPGVLAAISGYMGGKAETANYEAVCSGRTDHVEVVEVHFDPKILSFDELLDVFWSLHDPTQLNRQGPDRGRQYRSGIYYHSPEQKEAALASKDKLAKSGKFGSKPIVTEIVAATKFYPAEDYHQNYARINPRNPYLHHQLWPKLEKLGLIIPTGTGGKTIKGSNTKLKPKE